MASPQKNYHLPSAAGSGLKVRAADLCQETSHFAILYGELYYINIKYFLSTCHVSGFRHKMVVVLAWSPESMASIGSLLFEQFAENSHWHSLPLSHSPSLGAVSKQNQHHHTFP